MLLLPFALAADIDLDTLLPLPKTVSYTRLDRYDDLPEDVGTFKITYTDVVREPNRTIWTQCERRTDKKAEPECLKVFVGEGEYGNAASIFQGSWDWWSPPQVILSETEESWGQVHQKRGSQSRRMCRQDSSDVCEGGVVSACVTSFSNSRVSIAKYYCPGLGWVGEEALAEYEDGHVFRSSTLEVTIDGIPAPGLK